MWPYFFVGNLRLYQIDLKPVFYTLCPVEAGHFLGVVLGFTVSFG